MTRGVPLVATWVVALAALASACVRHVSPVEHGATVASDPGFSVSRYNSFACTTCHAVRPGEGDRTVPGAPLAGATARPSYWNGTVSTLDAAVALCYRRFMQGGALDTSTDEAVALYAYLDSLTATGPAQTDAVPFTTPVAAMAPAAGDATRGEGLYTRSCAYCHGAAHTGAGRISTLATVIPNGTEEEHTAAMNYSQDTLRQIFVEKVRHGNFLGLAGSMPPFSTEVLPDADLNDIIAYLNPQLRQ